MNSTQLAVYYTSLNCSYKEKLHSDRLVNYLSSKDYVDSKVWHRTSGKYTISFIDINQMRNQKWGEGNEESQKKGNIRHHLVEYYGLKKVDGHIPMPQVVLNEYKKQKRPKGNTKKVLTHADSGNSVSEADAKSRTTSCDQNYTNDRHNILFQRGQAFEERRGSYDAQTSQFAKANRKWVGDYNSIQYLMDCKLINQIIAKRQWTHFRLNRKVPIYSFTKGNGRDLPIKMWSTCYLSKNQNCRYNLVVVGSFLQNNCTELNELCQMLEDDQVYFYKIDKDNLTSEKDVEFLQKMKKHWSEEAKDEDWAAYLFGLKINLDTIRSLVENGGNLLQSIISRNRWLFWLKQWSKSKRSKVQPNNIANNKKISRDPAPICKSWIEEKKHLKRGDYLSSSEIIQQINKVTCKNPESNKKLKSGAKKNQLWLRKDFNSTSQKNVAMSCRNKDSNKHFTTDQLEGEYDAGVSVVKKKLHFAFPT